MKRRYILAPQAARDLVAIWRYLKEESSEETADRVESVIRNKFIYLAEFPNGGHWRRDLTSASVRFFSVYSYLIVYRPDTKPLQIVAVLHARRDIAEILPQRGV
ncbi:MAG TPA: type II toxin-antitoxin system RelE/ParE family toxin [Bryobacteraceae bacterium]|jgi:antitoxin ParD1/3/4/toxin ParE1/3/4|nr:type II toxin-antitoxin system RelE/ParE family toxin [Bryobacteraceae bacterium]